MTNCEHIQELLPWYVNQTLDLAERRCVTAHLETCERCAAALVHWRQIAHALTEPAPVAAVESGRSPAPVAEPSRAPALQLPARSFPARRGDHAPHAVPTRQRPQELWALVRVQARLLPGGLWPAVALVLVLGVAIVLTSHWPAHTALGILAPLAAAGSVVFACTPENDPRIPIAIASPLTARLVLLTRLVIVLAYDIALALAASLVLILVGHQPLDPLLTAWLAPMLGLASAALLATVVLDPGIAVAIAFALWALRWTTATQPSTIILLAIAAVCLTTATLRVQHAAT